MKIYTRKGDHGQTSLVDGRRAEKDDVQIEAIGAIDELNAHLGLLVSLIEDSVLIQWLHDIQHDLFDIGANLCIVRDSVFRLEQHIDEIDATLPVCHDFVMPCGSVQSAQCHVCRTVCRRAERRLVTFCRMSDTDGGVLQYVNRLSDFLFVLARKLNFIYDVDEKIWQNTCG